MSDWSRSHSRAATAGAQEYRVRPSRLLLVACTALGLLAAPTLAQGDIERTAFAPVIERLLARIHADVVPCDLVVDRATACFTLRPGSVALVAEGVEAMLAESAGTLVRSAWRSANGVHHVELLLDDDLWGVLEVWLSEPGDRTVSGLLKYVTRRRGPGP
jgi:hypothetical protein